MSYVFVSSTVPTCLTHDRHSINICWFYIQLPPAPGHGLPNDSSSHILSPPPSLLICSFLPLSVNSAQGVESCFLAKSPSLGPTGGKQTNLESHELSFGHSMTTGFAGHMTLATPPDLSEHPFLPQLLSPGLSPFGPRCWNIFCEGHQYSTSTKSKGWHFSAFFILTSQHICPYWLVFPKYSSLSFPDITFVWYSSDFSSRCFLSLLLFLLK